MKPHGISSGIRWCEGAMNWVDIIALLLSAVAAGFSIWSFFVERKRNRREATIHAFEELEKTVFLQDDYTSAPAEAKKEAEEHKLGRAWKRGTEYLSRIEHFFTSAFRQKRLIWTR